MEVDFEANNSKKYEIKAISNYAVYMRELKTGFLLKFNYHIFLKSYFKEKLIYKLTSLM